MCEPETVEEDERPENEPVDLMQYAIWAGTGKPVIPPPGYPRWRQFLDDYVW